MIKCEKRLWPPTQIYELTFVIILFLCQNPNERMNELRKQFISSNQVTIHQILINDKLIAKNSKYFGFCQLYLHLVLHIFVPMSASSVIILMDRKFPLFVNKYFINYKTLKMEKYKREFIKFVEFLDTKYLKKQFWVVRSLKNLEYLFFVRISCSFVLFLFVSLTRLIIHSCLYLLQCVEVSRFSVLLCQVCFAFPHFCCSRFSSCLSLFIKCLQFLYFFISAGVHWKSPFHRPEDKDVVYYLGVDQKIKNKIALRCWICSVLHSKDILASKSQSLFYKKKYFFVRKLYA